MRLWSVHSRYLDRAGLTACWREGLLAKKVLEGGTVGYRNHPQLIRFRQQADPVAAVNAYLHAVVDEAEARGYQFDRTKLALRTDYPVIEVTDAQLAYEWQHLLVKLKNRDPARYDRYRTSPPGSHPLFRVIQGPIESWERVQTLTDNS